MHILYIHQYFKTPQEGGATRSYFLSRFFASKGHQVTVLTTHNKKEIAKEYFKKLSIIKFPVKYDQSFSFLDRIISFIRFYLKAKHYVNSIKNIDCLYLTSTPLTVGFLGLFFKNKKNYPFVFEVRDLWPEVPIQLGKIKNSVLKHWLYKKEKLIYTSASAIVALSEDIQQYIININQKWKAKTIVVPNFSHPEIWNSEVSKPQEIFEILYHGSLGEANGILFFVTWAKYLKNHHLTFIRFVIIGEGTQKLRLSDQIKKYGLEKYFELKNKVNYEGLRPIINQADCVMVCYANHDILGTGSPNKLFDGLAAGKIIITNVRGWFEKMIRTSNAGFYINEDLIPDISLQINALLKDRLRLLSMQKHSRALSLRFEVSQGCQKVLKKIEAVIEDEKSID